MRIKSGNGSGWACPGYSVDDGIKAEVEASGAGIEGLSGRVDRYAEAHRRAVLMSLHVRSLGAAEGYARARTGLLQLADKLIRCGDYLLFRVYQRLNTVRLHAAEFCHVHHLCPFCAIRRGAKLLRLYLLRFEVLTLRHPESRGYFVTVTVKDGADLVERFSHLRRNVQRLTARRHSNERGAAGSVMCSVLGGVGAYEFKRGSGSGLWHPHFHGVFLSENPVDQVALAAEWHALTGDSFVVDVRELYGESAVLGFLECFKYAVKFSDLPLDDNFAAYRVLKRARLVTSFGCFRGIDVSGLDDDPVPEDEPYIELFYRYRHGAGYSFDAARSSQVAQDRAGSISTGTQGGRPPITPKSGHAQA